MTKPFTFNILASSTKSSARTGIFTTAHGEIRTPVFMPVGTKATVKALTMEDVEELDSDIILGNTYHLYLRPGHEFLEEVGGLHRFGTWKKSILTDSGGFQVFSLGAGVKKRGLGEGKPLVKISEEGVEFKSYLDGSTHFFTPESNMEIQGAIGGDIVMAFDECAPADEEEAYIRNSVDRTHRWLERCIKHFAIVQEKRKQTWGDMFYPQTFFPIVQGGVIEKERIKSAQFIASTNQDGVAIGGLSVGETKEDMYRILDVVDPHLPKDKPRYLMGVGTPEDLLEGVARGIDMFDCVLPTRLGRHGTFFTHEGKMTITNQKFTKDFLPLDPLLTGGKSDRYSRAFIRHLFIENEILALHLLSYHNVKFLLELMKTAREKIQQGVFETWKDEFLAKYFGK